MRRRGISRCALLAGLAAAATADLAAAADLAALADTQAIDVTTVGTYPPLTPNGFNYFQPPGNYTFTWNFTAKSAIDVTQLGYYDSALAGTPEPSGFGSHLVSLLDLTTDQTLASASVTSASPATGDFNYAAISPVALNTSDTYQVAGAMTNQYYLVGLNQSAAPLAPQINYGFTTGNIFGGSSSTGTYADFGPNFQFAQAARCTENRPGHDVIALAGDVCAASPGAYNPTTAIATLPFAYNGYGFYAQGGTITSAGAVSVTTTNPNGGGGSYGVWANGAGSQITLNGASSITTAGANSFGALANGGGQIVATAALNVATTGAGAIAVYATGAGASIAAASGAISTTGAGAVGVQADRGGVVTLGGAGAATSIATTGANAPDAFATGAGSLISATDVVARYAGVNSAAALADQGARIEWSGGSIASSGRSAVNAQAANSATLTLSGATLSASGAGAQTIFATSGGRIDARNVTLTASGGADTLSGTAAGLASNNAFPGYSTAGGTLNISGSTLSATGQGAYGVYTADGGVTTLSNDSIAVGAVGAAAVISGAGGQTTITGGTTRADGADTGAVSAYGGGAVSASGGAKVTATGLGSAGVTVAGAASSFTGADVAILVQGGYDSATGSHANGISNQTYGAYGGGGAVNLTNSTITLTGNAGEGVYNANGGSVTMTGGAIATSGLVSDGVYGVSGSAAHLSGVQIATTGDGAQGLFVSDAGTTLTGSRLTIATAGAQAAGVASENGATTTLTGGAATTKGVLSDAVFAASGSVTTLNNVTLATTGDAAKGIDIQGTGTKLTGAGLTISTSGTTDAATGFQAQGVFNGAATGQTGGGVVSLMDSSVTTSGADAHGVETANGGATTFAGGSISTSGTGAVALLASSGGAVTVQKDSAGQATTIVTSGFSTAAVAANSGASIAVTGASIISGGAGSTGVSLRDAGTAVTLTSVSVSTTGRVGPNGDFALALHNGGGALTMTNVVATTLRDGASGLVTDSGSRTSATGGSIATSGADAAAVLALSASQMQLSGVTLTTQGEGSAGLALNGAGGDVSASGLSITTAGGVSTATGSHADGVYNGSFGARTGGGALTLADSTVTTHGDQAYGVSVGAGGATTLLGGAVATSGAGSQALRVAGGGSLTVGADALGVAAIVKTSGAGALGLAVNDAGTTASANGVTIATSGALAYGAYNGPGANGTSGGSLTLDNVKVSTRADQTAALVTGAGATTTASGGAYSTSGAGAAAALARDGGALTISGADLTTSGQGAYGASATSGATLALGDGVSIAATGAGAHGLYVAAAAADLTGAVTINVSGANAAGVYVDAGGAVGAKGPLTVNAATYGLYVNGGSEAPTALGLAGPLTLKTSDPAGAAITLSGDNVAFAGSGGGVVDAAGAALAFLNGAGQSASFDNYQINGADIIYADPATATATFVNSVANAGTGDLAKVVGGSDLTLTAVASTLTGAIETQAGAFSHVTLSGGSVWNITGNSTVSNLALLNASANFAPSPAGVFHTLTVTNFIGQGGSLTFNAALGGANPGADRLVINGGQATGATTINIRPLGNVGAATSGLGVPLVVTSNGGSLAPGAFALSGPLTVGGYTYSLQSQGGDEYLVSNQTLSPAAASGSLASLAQSRQSQAITGRVLTSILLGATEQINCSSCSSGFASFGSFALGAHGRWTLSPSLALLAGASYDSYSARGVTVNNSLEAAIGLRYDMVQLGHYRPFFEAGIAVSPYANISFSRSYVSGAGAGVGVGDTLSRSAAAYGRAGYIWRLTPRDEAAAYGSFTRSWQSSAGYLEGATGGNPFGALVLPSLDTMNIAEVGAQYTHLFGEHIEANVSAGYAVAFDANYGADASISGFGPASGLAPTSFNWVELGGRLSYRFSKNVIADAFVLGTVGAEPAGSQIHGGLALRMEF